jgi:Beta-lactamase class C and other penicillin binding proteins
MYRLCLLFSGLCLLGLAACQNPEETATTEKAEPAPPAVQPRIDSLMQQLAANDKMYAGVAVSRDGELVHNQAYGYAAIKDGDTIAADHTTPYRIGSITKTFTATLFMQMLEKGKISLSTKLSEFYPDMPNADSITMEHMLRHRSGLHNYTRDSIFGQSRNIARTKQEMLAHFRNTEPEFQPGEKFQYSNTNYVLLGYILEDISGKPYPNCFKIALSNRLG